MIHTHSFNASAPTCEITCIDVDFPKHKGCRSQGTSGTDNGLCHGGSLGGTCDENHGDCDPVLGPMAYNQLKKAVANHDVVLVRQIVKGSHAKLTLNFVRGSLQMRGCKPGVIIANLPLSTDVLRQLRAS